MGSRGRSAMKQYVRIGNCSVALMLLLSACTRFEHLSPQASVDRSRVEVRFATPIQLVGRTGSGGEIVRSQVTWLAGRPLEVRNDSLVVEVRGTVSSEGGRRRSPMFIAVVPTKDACVDIGVRRFSGSRTAAAVLVPVSALVLFSLYCGGRPGCDPLY